MSLSAADKKEVIRKYAKELGYRAIEISKGTGLPFFTITQILNCDDCDEDEAVLSKIMQFLECGKSQTVKHVFCTGSGCEAMKACIAEKNHLIQMQDETIKMLREKIKNLSNSR